MIKKNKIAVIVSSFIILIPLIAGLVMWKTLPDTMPVHWKAQGEADGYSNKTFAVVIMPVILLAVHLLCLFITSADPKNKNIEKKPFFLVVSIIPILSLAVGGCTYATALGHKIDISVVMPLIMGGLFVVIGNYLPKCRQNYTIGIKIPWTLSSEENWNKTHRFAGIVWVIGGALVMATSFMGSVYIMTAILLIMAFIPIIYSYAVYRRNNKSSYNKC